MRRAVCAAMGRWSAPSQQAMLPRVRQQRNQGHTHPGADKMMGLKLGSVGNTGGFTTGKYLDRKSAGTHVSLSPMNLRTPCQQLSFQHYAERPWVDMKKDKYGRLLGQPNVKAVITKLIVKKPRRPNSGKVLCCVTTFRRPSVRTGEPVTTTMHTFIGNKATPLREYSVVQVGKKRKRGVAVKYYVCIGEYDYPGKKFARKRRKQFKGQLGY